MVSKFHSTFEKTKSQFSLQTCKKKCYITGTSMKTINKLADVKTMKTINKLADVKTLDLKV